MTPEIIVSPKQYKRLLDAMEKGFEPPRVSASIELMFYLEEFERANNGKDDARDLVSEWPEEGEK